MLGQEREIAGVAGDGTTLADEPEGPSVAPISSGIFQFVFITGCIILFVLISKLYLDQYLEIRKLEQRLEQERSKVTESQQEIVRLTHELEFLRTDEGTEKIAREKLKMVKPEEIIIVPVETVK